LPIGADELLFWKLFDGKTIEMGLDICESDDYQFTAAVAFNDDAPLFKPSGESATDAAYIMYFRWCFWTR